MLAVILLYCPQMPLDDVSGCYKTEGVLLLSINRVVGDSYEMYWFNLNGELMYIGAALQSASGLDVTYRPNRPAGSVNRLFYSRQGNQFGTGFTSFVAQPRCRTFRPLDP